MIDSDYHVGSDLGWSDLFWFQAYPAADDTNWSPRVAMFGDLVLSHKALFIMTVTKS